MIRLCALAVMLFSPYDLPAAPIPVRFFEGLSHGLVLRSSKGEPIAYGEQLQVTRERGVESRLVFRFKDGSIHDETVSFTQREVFAEKVHFVPFTPKPRVALFPAGEDPFSLGGIGETATRYVIKPRLGVLGPLASLFGKSPADYHYWIANGEAPGFLAFEGPLYLHGPLGRVELAAPVLNGRS